MRRAVAHLLAVAALGIAPAGSRAAAGDPDQARQWGLGQIGAPAAWAESRGAGVTIGIVDTGVDLSHEDLAAKVDAHTRCRQTGGDASRCSGDGQDDVGHGTHVAGIAAAVTGNAKGIAGVAPDARLVVAAFADVPDITAGIRWVVDHGAGVVNLSLGPVEPLSGHVAELGGLSEVDVKGAVRQGCGYAWSQGAVCVVASGNEDTAGVAKGLTAGVGSYEYGDLDAIVVGATDRNGTVASYSNPTGNAKWAVLAPGGTGPGGDEADGIYSTYWVEGEKDRYGYLAGTSMAAPHVTGAVALLLAQGLSREEAVHRLLATADAGAGCGPNSPTCRGLIDVARAVGATG